MRRRATYIRPRTADPYPIIVCCLVAALLALGVLGALLKVGGV